MGHRFKVRGLVQGVGFRPFVYRLAQEERLTGTVRNTGEGVEIDLFGPPPAIETFRERLCAELPPLARMDKLECSTLTTLEPDDFHIDPSSAGPLHASVTPDASLCAACATEMRDPDDRRYGYAFLNCTHCGPRFSILSALPYDRANTAMAGFPMCDACLGEYDDVADRRFHAQPVACPACGPTLWAERPGDPARIDTPIAAAAEILAGGGIVALKGIGGFHLACVARNRSAIARLRRLKRRPSKPLAVMVADIATAQALCAVSDAERTALTSPSAPIVLLDLRASADLPETLAPGLNRLGLMLPYTPLHALLLDAVKAPLVMTSGNPRGAPQVTDNDVARVTLGEMADLLLLHDRDIINRVDDSVLQVVGDKNRVMRRARGLAPRPLALPQGFGAHPQALALGGDIKNAFAIAKDGVAVLSQHIGDVGILSVQDDLTRTIQLFRSLYDVTPEMIVADLHPGYKSTAMARRMAEAARVPLIEVAHHHAHAAACMAEHGLPRDHAPVLALVQDGIGVGPEGALWGAELLRCDYRQAERLATLRPASLPGGDMAAHEPWRNLLSRLSQIGSAEVWPTTLAAQLKDRPTETLLAAMRSGINSPDVSSAGRLFDAVAAAIGIASNVQSFEGEAAMFLQAAAERCKGPIGKVYWFDLQYIETGMMLIDPAPIWTALGADMASGQDATSMALQFHVGWAEVWHRATVEAASRHCIDTIFLSGGVFQNRLLADILSAKLRQDGLTVHQHAEVPTHDGGIALGQIAIALARNSDR